MFHFDFLKFEIKNRTFPDTEEVTLMKMNNYNGAKLQMREKVI